MANERYFAFGLVGISLLSVNHADGSLINKYWVKDASNVYAGNLNDANHWSDSDNGPGGGTLPDTNDLIYFNNGQASAYEVDLTVQTSTSTIPNVRQFNVPTDKVIFDLNDKTFRLPGRSGQPSETNPLSDLRVGVGNDVSGELTLTSSTATKGLFTWTGANGGVSIGVGTGTLASTGKLTLENGARLSRGSSGATTVGLDDGSLGILDVNGGSYSDSVQLVVGRNASAEILVRNGGTLTSGVFIFGSANTLSTVANDVTVDGSGSTMTGAITYGNNGIAANASYRTNTTILITNGGTASAVTGAASAQYYGFADGARGANTTALTTVNGNGSTMRSGFHYIGGNAAQAWRSTHEVVSENAGLLGAKALLKVWEAAGTGAKGTLTLDQGIVELDGQTTISSVAYTGELSVGGVLRGTGTIRRQAGTGSNLIKVDVLGTAAGAWAGATAVNGELRPGDTTSTPAVGTLRIENGNLNLTTNGTQAGTLHLDLAADGSHDQIVLEATDVGNSGLVTASLLGALDYTVDGSFSLSSKPFFDMVIAQGVVHNPLSDDLTTALSSLGYTADVDYTYGVVTIAAGDYENDQYAGYEALRLALIPEPATISLLALAGLMVGHRRRDRRSQR